MISAYGSGIKDLPYPETTKPDEHGSVRDLHPPDEIKPILPPPTLPFLYL